MSLWGVQRSMWTMITERALCCARESLALPAVGELATSGRVEPSWAAHLEMRVVPPNRAVVDPEAPAAANFSELVRSEVAERSVSGAG